MLSNLTKRAYNELLWAIIREKENEFNNLMEMDITCLGEVIDINDGVITYDMTIEPGNILGKWPTQEKLARYVLVCILDGFHLIDRKSNPVIYSSVWHGNPTEEEQMLIGDNFTPNLKAKIVVNI